MSLNTLLFRVSGFDFVERNCVSPYGFSRKLFAYSVFLLHSAYVSVNLRFQFNFHVELFNHPDVLGNTTNLVEMVLPLLCHLVVVAEAFRKAKSEEKMKNLMAKLRSSLRYDAQPATVKLPLAKILFLFVVNSLLFIGIIIMVSNVAGKCSLIESRSLPQSLFNQERK